MINAVAHADEVIATAAHCMSRMGQTRKSGDAITTSALPPTADIPGPAVASEKCQQATSRERSSGQLSE